MSYRLSSYSIFIERDNDPSHYILIHGYTGTIDIVSTDIVSFLRGADTFDKDSFPFSDSTWDNLLKRGYLTAKTKEEEFGFVKKMADVLHKKGRLFNVFTFLVSYDCNFRCPYCYEASISGNGRKWTKQTFTEDMVDKAYEAISKIRVDERTTNKSIQLYGGEPLLAENKKIVEYIVKQGKQRGYVFNAVTNGYDLDAYEDLLGPDNITRLQITVDGDREWHNKRRIHYQNPDSFDKIIANIGIALAKGTVISVRINTDRNNIDSIKNLRRRFDELGYTADENFHFYSAWLASVEKEDRSVENAAQIDYMDYKEYYRKIVSMNNIVSCNIDKMYRHIYRAISKGEHISLSSVGCASQCGSYIFDPYGEMYSCLETIGNRRHVVGKYISENGIEWNDRVLGEWHRNASDFSGCRTCKHLFFCQGGCIADRINDKKDYGGSTICDSFRDRLRISANKAYDNYLKSGSVL